jgi:hypothetical protein
VVVCSSGQGIIHEKKETEEHFYSFTRKSEDCHPGSYTG